ncbi:MAG: DNA mismatch repair protein MutS [Otoolea sp.]
MDVKHVQIEKKAAEQVLEFDRIKEQWMELAVTEAAKQRIRETVPCLSERELLHRLKETTESRLLLEKCGNPPLVSLNGMEEILMIASKGDCLTAGQLSKVKGALVAVKRLRDYLEKGKSYDISLAYDAENLETLEPLKEAIEEAVFNDEVADSASVTLREIRRSIMRAEEEMREKADQMIRKNKECMSDSFSTFRNGRLCLPVKKEYKFRIPGSVLDKSSTGNTLFVEPVALADLYEELQQWKLEEEDEVRRILYTLTVEVDTCSEPLRQNIRTMEKLDYAFSKGKLSLEQGGTAPVIEKEQVIRLKDARHPLLAKDSCVPLQFQIGDGVQGIIITGPNTGGKTVAIKTVALLSMMAQCGLHVSCERAELGMFSNFLCDIGDGQSLSENLSTFSAHITNVLEILKRANRESLVIMDELGSGTDPQEGMGIAVAVLEELKRSGALFLVTTHYPEIKAYAEKEEGILNARMTFDAENLKPMYQMVIGEAGQSCALQIAKRLGMPEFMLRRARKAAYGTAETETEKTESQEAAETETERKGMAETLKKECSPHVIRRKQGKMKKEITFRRGDSVMVSPDRKIGIVCQEADDKGILRVQLQGKKIWINHKRVKLLVPADQLYPEDYDFSIVFDTVEKRKLSHDMSRKYVEGEIVIEEERKE